METFAHQRLKVLSIALLRAMGCAAVAAEVRCPASRFRADVAGFADPLRKQPSDRHTNVAPGYCLRVSGRATTVLVECKQSRADFLRDGRELGGLLAERHRLDAHRRHLEERLLMAAEPHLRGSGSMLFPELEAWDFAASRSPTYRGVLRDLRRLDLQIHGHTKFCMVARYRLADLLFISSPQGMLRPAEMPPGWGLLEFPLEWLEGRSNDRSGEHGPGLVSVRLRHAGATPELTRPDHRLRLLRNIAVAATLRLEADAGCRGRVPAEFRVAVHDPHPVVAWEKEGGPASDAGPPG